MPDEIEVTQEDREAAADWLLDRDDDPDLADVVRRGEGDGTLTVQAFALHAKAARLAEQERAAKIAEEWPEYTDTPFTEPAQLPDPDDENDIGLPEQHGFRRSFAKPKDIAQAIRGLL